MADPFQIVGTSLEGKYRIDKVVGEGGFGVVYRGYHLSFKQPIAIKCLKVPAHFTPDARELFLSKFREEGEHLARLGEHPSITRVYDFGIVEGSTPIPYLVLEWLDGEDLEQLLAKRRATSTPFSEREALQLLRPAIDALSLAHSLGIAHRDIKPPNLYWAKGARGQTLKVLDFGIAKAMAEGDTATQIATKTSSGFSAFSPSYGAPEQFRSKKFGATGPWTDVHAIGLILSEMASGRAALEGEEMIEFYEQCSKDTRPTPRALGAEVSDQFEALCLKALALAPKERFANTTELLGAVDELLAGTAAPPKEAALPAQPKASPATVLAGPLETGSAPNTVLAGPLEVGSAPNTVLAGPLEVGRAPKVEEPSRNSPARFVLGAAALAAVVGGIVYATTREPTADSPVAPSASASSVASSTSSSASPIAVEIADPAELKIEELDVGTGDRVVRTGDKLLINYVGRLLRGGSQFDASSPGQPFKVTVGEGVLEAMSQGLIGMRKDGKRKLTVPSRLAYGAKGIEPTIPPNAPLVFEIQLVDFVGIEGDLAGSGLPSAARVAPPTTAPRTAPTQAAPTGRCQSGRNCRASPDACHGLACCNANPGYNSFEVCRLDDNCICRERN